MKIYTINFDETAQKFVSELHQMTSEDIEKLLEKRNPFVKFQAVHKKYFAFDCKEECDTVVADLNERLCQKGDTLEHGQIRVARCKKCNEIFAVERPRRNNGHWIVPSTCLSCHSKMQKKQRTAK